MAKNQKVSQVVATGIQIGLLFLVTFLMLAVSLIPAILEWYAKTDAEPLRVVREQDMSIRHFATSFRTQVNTFLYDNNIDLANPPEPFEGIWHIDQPVSFLGKTERPELRLDELKERLVNRVLLGAAELVLPGDMVFEEEVYCRGSLACGDRAAFRALYCEEGIVLGDECVVVRWLHSDGTVTVGAQSRLFGRLSANRSVTIGSGCEFERMSSPVIRFAAPLIHRPTPVERSTWQADERMESIDEDTLLSAGAISIEDATSVRSNLIAKKQLSVGRNVDIQGSLKAHKSLRIGSGSVIRGAIVCGGEIEIDDACLIKGPLISETSIQIGAGCVIGTPGMPTSVSAPRIYITCGAQISGTLWAGLEGRVVD
ncbi:MAG: putative acyltransferase (DUF342 family) [Gammaproteobacteria bacterium]|jgi:predicted acyltransferase (DUF342 family)